MNNKILFLFKLDVQMNKFHTKTKSYLKINISIWSFKRHQNIQLSYVGIMYFMLI